MLGSWYPIADTVHPRSVPPGQAIVDGSNVRFLAGETVVVVLCTFNNHSNRNERVKEQRGKSNRSEETIEIKENNKGVTEKGKERKTHRREVAGMQCDAL